jgi:uncharacterized membrane protein
MLNPPFDKRRIQHELRGAHELSAWRSADRKGRRSVTVLTFFKKYGIYGYQQKRRGKSFMSRFLKYLTVLGISMVPLIELRGAIPVGAGWGLRFVPTYLLSVLGNMLPVPIILLLVKIVLDFMKKKSILPRLVNWLENKAQKGAKRIEKHATVGLFLFVAIPLPGTGAWTGALAAALLGMKRWWAMLSIFLGVLVAGLIMSLVSYGFLSAFEFLL